MSKFRKKPVVIEAVRWDGENFDEVTLLSADGRIARRGHVLVVSTLEGDMIAGPGDWIIRGVAGEVYPCKPDIFDKTYELVTGEQNT